MPNACINSHPRQFSSSRQLNFSDQARRAQIPMRPPENPSLAANQDESRYDSRHRRLLNDEKLAMEENQTDRHRRPRNQQAESESSGRPRPPKLPEGMHHKPVDRNWQLQEQHDRRQPSGKTHARILVGAALAAQGDSELAPRLARSIDRNNVSSAKSRGREI